MREHVRNAAWHPEPSMERSQVYVRYAFIVVFGTYIAIALFNQPQLNPSTSFALVYIIAIYAVAAFLIQYWNLRDPSLNHRRITYGIVLDISTITAILFSGGEATLALYPIYLWIIIASGFRYGARYLYLAQSLSIVGFVILLITDQYWSIAGGISVSIIITIGPLPLYIGFLLKKLEEQIRLNVLVDRDALTGAYNRRYAEDYLTDVVAGSIEKGDTLSLVMIDIDHFKRINDNHGHLIGDEVLQEVVKRIRNVTRQQDILIRYGGEEFLLVLQLPLKGSLDCAERVRACFEEHPIRTKDTEIRITASLGVSTLSHEIKTHQELIQMADFALYRAKEYGRNQVVVFSETFFSEISPKRCAMGTHQRG